MKKFIKIFALCLTLALMLSVSALAAELVVESVPTEFKLSEAGTSYVNITGSYEAGQLVSLEIKSKTDGTVVLSQQAVCDETDAFVLNGIMSDEVKVGDYEIKINARGAAAQTYNLKVVPNGTAVKVNVVTGGASRITVAVNDGVATEWYNGEVYPMGTKLTLTAICDENHTFLYWKDAASGKIISENEFTDIIVGLDTTIEAVFADNRDTAIYVTFKANNQLLVTGTKDSIMVPDNPYIAGYRFDAWFVNGNKFEGENLLDVTENTTYVAGFLLEETEYTVTVDGAEFGTFKYNEKVTVEAEEVKDGLVFTNWTRDGEVVSYDSTYSFFVNGNTDLVANYAADEVEKGVVLVMAQPTVVATNKIAFYAERNVPAEYKVIESGIILSQEADFDLKTPDIKTAKATYTSNNGQFTVRKGNVNVGDTWYGRAYLIYSDAEENTYTVYSNIAGCTR